jgi:hypothetical protein
LVKTNYHDKKTNKNMTNSKQFIAFLLNLLFLAACNNSTEILYLDDNFPGLEPKIYAPGILSLPDRNEHGLASRNNGVEDYFGLDGRKSWTYNGLVCLKKGDNNNLIFDTLNFTNLIVRKNNGIIAGEPSFSLDNQVLYFVADYPTDIWKVRINKNGKWGNPVKLDSIVNSESSEWTPTVAHDNCLYFARDLNGNVAIHKAELVNGEYKKVSKFEASFNYDCGDQVFSKNMDYIIFTSPREGGYGNIDIYVAFKKDNGEWTQGINMGSDINTEGFELTPYISPDDKYLFFTRRHELGGISTSDIYWVSLDIVSKIKSEMK